MGSLTNRELPRMRKTSMTGLPSLRSCSIMATRQSVMIATCICIRTAFSDSPQKDLTRKCCLIHLNAFKDSKQFLCLGKCQSQDFDAQIASTTVSMIQYNFLCMARRFRDYESLGGIFRNSNAETLQLTVAQKIWQLILETISEIAQILDIDIKIL
jgi:hypothetical protein